MDKKQIDIANRVRSQHGPLSRQFNAHNANLRHCYDEFKEGRPAALQGALVDSCGGYGAHTILRFMAEDGVADAAVLRTATALMDEGARQNLLDSALAQYAERKGMEGFSVALMEAGANPAKVRWKNPVVASAIKTMQARLDGQEPGILRTVKLA